MSKARGFVRVYQGQGPLDAHHLAHWLERNHITVRVHADLAGLAGGIPVHDSWPSLWVAAADSEKALEAIRAYQGPQIVHPEWSCPSCGEENGPNFGACWNCDTTRAPN